MNARRLSAAAAAAVAMATLAACSTAPPSSNSNTSSGASSATSAASFGGMSKLVAAAKKEGTLNVIALPPDWADYGKIIKKFEAKYGIKVNSEQPDGASQDEINAANQLKGRPTDPDVFDLGESVALANTKMFAPYKTAEFAQVPAAFKAPNGLWVNDYGGYSSIGYNSKKVPAPKTLNDLLKPAYKGKVALNGDPTQAGAAYGGVLMAALANGGSANNIAPGVKFFAKLKKAGNFLPVDPTPATIASGQTPVVIDWDYTNAAAAAQAPGWKVVVPGNQPVAGYYYQAINKDAPHPAAARLWEEFLYSPQAQNLFLAGGARPVLADAMKKAGTLNTKAYAKLPAVHGKPVLQTGAQVTKAAAYLSKNWASAVK